MIPSKETNKGLNMVLKEMEIYEPSDKESE